MPTSPDIDPDTPLRAASNVISTALPGETVILDPASGHYFGLDGVGPRVWEMLETPTSLRAMVEQITAEYDVDAATCERDLRELLSGLAERDLVVIGDDDR